MSGTRENEIVANTNMNPAVEALNLTKRFPRAHGYKELLMPWRREWIPAVSDVSLSVRSGELFSLLGPNGAGKTTLVKMLATLVTPTSGTASVLGYDVRHEEQRVKRMIALVDGQERSFFWRLTGRQNLQFFCALYNLNGKKAKERVEEVLNVVGLDEQADRRFQDYSSGMRQKLAIARGLIGLCPIILMDEPTKSLDPLSALNLRSFVKKRLLGELGLTIILVTHNLAEAEDLSDRIAVMNNGRVIASGSPHQLKRLIRKREQYTLDVDYLGEETLASLSRLEGVVQSAYLPSNGHEPQLQLTLNDARATLPQVFRIVVEQGGSVRGVHRSEVSLEEAFVDLIEGREVVSC